VSSFSSLFSKMHGAVGAWEGQAVSVQLVLHPLSKGLRKEPSGALRYLYLGQFASSFVVTFLAT